MNLVITGPRSVGKSTISKIVAEKLGLEYVSSDEIGDKAMEHLGGLDKAIKSKAIEGFINQGGYTLILDVFRNKKDFIFDLSGGSVSSRKMPEASAEVRAAAKKNSFIAGLLPSENEEESVKFLFEREKERVHFREIDKAELHKKVDDDYRKFPPLFREFCNMIVYTRGKTPEKIAEEIIRKVSGN